MSRFPGDVATELDLLGEWLSLPGLTGRHIRQLADAGVTTAAWIKAGHLATPRISAVGRLFTPDPFGQPAFVLPIYDGEPVGELNPDPTILLADLCAFHLDEPERWCVRRGEWGLVLGKDKFLEAMVTGSNITLHATPLQWIQAECEGACPLDLAEEWQAVCTMREHLESLEAAA